MMRLEKIKIINFGQLSNLTFDLTSPAVSVFFGANEAGKSTTVAFIEQVMFGFYLRSNSAPFFEDYKPLGHVSPMGGSLLFKDEKGQQFELERLWAKGDKTKRGILTVKKDGQVVPPNLFFDQIQNIDGNFYTASFIFNQEMLARVTSLSQEDLLERIYYLGAANSGQLLLLRDDFAKKADSLFKKTGRKPLVNRLLQKVAAQQTAYEESQDELKNYQLLSAVLKKQEEQLATSQAKISKLQEQQAKLSQIKGQLVNFAKLQALEKKRKPVQFNESNYQQAKSLAAQEETIKEDLAAQKKEAAHIANKGGFDWAQARKLVQKKAAVLVWQKQVRDDQVKIRQLEAEDKVLGGTSYALEQMRQWAPAKIKACQQDYEALPPVTKTGTSNNNLFWLLAAILMIAGLIMISRGAVGLLLLICGLVLLGWQLWQRRTARKVQEKVAHSYAAFKQKYRLDGQKIDLPALLAQLNQCRLKEQAATATKTELSALKTQLSTLAVSLSKVLQKTVRADFEDVLAALDQVDVLAETARHKQERAQDLQARIKDSTVRLSKVELKLKAVLAKDGLDNLSAYEQRYQSYLAQARVQTQISALKASLGKNLSSLECAAQQPEQIKLEEKKLAQELEQNKQLAAQQQDKLAQTQVKRQQLADSQAALRAKQDLADAQTDLTRASREYLANFLAAKWLSRTLDIASNERFPKMLAAACTYLRLLTGGRYTSLSLGKKLSVTRFDGKKLAVKYLSRGTAEQLYFALKLAFIAQIKDEINLPILIDDSFVNFDDRRISYIAKLLRQISSDHQVLIFTAQQALVNRLGQKPLRFRKEANHAETTA